MIDNKIISSKLKEYFNKIGKTQKEISTELGVTQQAVSVHLNGRPFGKNNAKLWSDKFGLNPLFLLTGEGEMLKEDVKKNDAEIFDTEASSDEFLNKHGNKIKIFDDGKYLITTPLVEFSVYAGKINEYQEAVLKSSFKEEITFPADHYPKGYYLSFKVSGYSMDNGSLYDTPDGAVVLARELGKQHWSDGFNDSKYGWIIISESGMVFKDIIGFDKKTATITLHSRNTSPEFSDFTLCLNNVFQIFKVIKRSF